jgi:predicted nucleotidyltransferase component of viral defense system
MLPRFEIQAWRSQAPWADEADIEQDLIITRALLQLFDDAFIRESLALRGGTAIHKLYLSPAARYSEDIDLVQRHPEGIGPTFDRIREILAWLGRPRVEIGEVPKLSFRFVSESGLKRRLKIEINTHEHFAGVVAKTFAVDHRAARGSVEIPTHSLNELLATKLRAFCQRDKGRDLFDLWWSHRRDAIDPGEIVRLFLDYMSHGGDEADSAPELRAKLVAKHARGIFEEVRPLLRTGVEFDTEEALEWFETEFVGRLRNDDGTRLFTRTES